MNAHTARLDTPAALVTKASNILGRIMRVAAHVAPTQCLHLQGELALVAQVLEDVEQLAVHEAQFYAALATMKPKRAIPPPCPAFKGGRGLLPAPHHASPKRLTAGRRA